MADASRIQPLQDAFKICSVLRVQVFVNQRVSNPVAVFIQRRLSLPDQRPKGRSASIVLCTYIVNSLVTGFIGLIDTGQLLPLVRRVSASLLLTLQDGFSFGFLHA